VKTTLFAFTCTLGSTCLKKFLGSEHAVHFYHMLTKTGIVFVFYCWEGHTCNLYDLANAGPVKNVS